jgi:hypothetical protein
MSALKKLLSINDQLFDLSYSKRYEVLRFYMSKNKKDAKKGRAVNFQENSSFIRKLSNLKTIASCGDQTRK